MTSQAAAHPCGGNADNTFSALYSDDPRQNLVLRKIAHSPVIKEFHLHCPVVAKSAGAGQFVIVRGDDRGERVPLTIADYDRDSGLLVLVLQVVGLASHKLDEMEEGDSLLDVVGPLGHKSEIDNFGVVACIGGGLGIAPVYPIQRALKQAGNRVISIIGARSRDLLFWEDKMRAVSDRLIVTTDDGSVGEKAFVNQPLKAMLEKGDRIDRVVAIGPPVMMRAVAETTRPFNVKTIVSLNSIMVDGTGMCGCCRVEVGGKTRFTCVDGPEFDAHEVDFAMLLSRLSPYREKEAAVYSRHRQPEVAEVKKAPGRTPMPEQDPAVRAKNFSEVALGYEPEMARSEAARCLQCKRALCVDGCPVNVDIPAFIHEIREGRFGPAAKILKRTNNLPAICGRVCPQETQCEARCVLGRKGEPVAIGRLERFAADSEAASGISSIPARPALSGKRVAIVGSGPSGLTAGADLALLGHDVIIFEALHAPGGVLAYGIPEFRLPKAIVRQECDYLRRIGVEFRMDYPIGPTITVPKLLETGFDAVFIGSG
ncbi:MAG: sulfide/dihydroorotate dehydrogenase-like FAD/NAD-binding protein, partial [Planctomycetota bacterium]|nr:sulfide/dihydroorotate dehydrogenase-like FAD/NAD-binding protein [Planctomycetota bacterium]